MQSKVRTVFIVFLSSFFIFTTCLIPQLRRTLPQNVDITNLIKIKGWVYYINRENLQEKNLLEAEMDVDLIKNDTYKIAVVKINGKKMAYRHEPVYYDYSLFNYPYTAKVGDLIELKVGIVKKNEITIAKNVQYYTVAKFKINNLYKKFLYFAPDQLINLNLIHTPFIVLKWKFTNFMQNSRITINSLNTKRIRVFSKNENCKINTKDLAFDKTYKLEIGAFWGLKHNFEFTKFVNNKSELTFSHSYNLKFKTSKRLNTLKKIEIR